MPVWLNKYVVGQQFDSNNKLYGSFIVLNINSSTDVDIKFISTGTIVKTVGRSLVKGQVKDPSVPVVFGVGYMGIGSYVTTGKYKKIYTAWVNMLGRCYDVKNKGYPAYGKKGYYVNSVWHNYQNYAHWYVSNVKEFKGLHIDKDILFKGNKEYGPDKCKFVPRYINTLLMLNESKRGIYPIGVQPPIWGVYYKAAMSDKHNLLGNANSCLGKYESPILAHSAWQTAKIKLIEASINRYATEPWFDSHVAAALLDRVWKIRMEQSNGLETTSL